MAAKPETGRLLWRKEISIGELAELTREIVGFRGRIEFAPDKPDGAPRKLMDITRLRSLGWQPSIPLGEGLADTVAWFRSQG